MKLDRTSLNFVVSFIVIGVGFLASTLYAESRSTAIDREVAEIVKNSIPSVANLVVARGALRHLEVASERLARVPPEQRATTVRLLSMARRDLDRAVDAELLTPDYEGEHAILEEAKKDILELEALVDQEMMSPSQEGDAADAALHASVDQTDDAIERWLAVNAEGGKLGVYRIIAVRRDSMTLAMALDAICIALSMMAAGLALRALRRRAEVEESNVRFLAERADELEIFAKRVAHDLLSPLSSLSFSLQAFKRAAEVDPKLAQALARARGCISRAQSMVDGIFEFARSGASAVQGGRADVRDIVQSVTEEVRGSATDADLVVEDFEDWTVACSPGVLMSVLANLVRNAVKFTSDSSLKQITMRVRRDGDNVQVEVEDTGPGVPDGMEEAIFRPYVRGDGVTQSGLGLGLATVKRLCEAHQGSVGVRSSIGRGAVFWFTLPLVPERPSDG
jgi:signal transduction histidine kinase